MRNTLIAALALLATGFAVAAPSANATVDYCEAAQVIDLAGQAYVVVNEIAGEKFLFSLGAYAESNGEAGLQRGGSSLTFDPDSCQESSNPDLNVV